MPVRLRSLTLHGFKSFGNRTHIDLHPGVSAIVGPNGSGKSNLIDALRWATGGGRASAYRADDKRDLIFHGAEGKRSVGYAEVEVEFEPRAGGRLSIARSITRDGTTKLTLNGKNARFLDVDEALSGSGLGTSGLSVIGQGEISEVLMADPERLLQYVAEAAGVARLAGRRERTEARLATAREHLDRLEEIMRELATRLERLRGEAAEAARVEELEREALHLRFTAAAARVEGLDAETAELAERADALQTALEGGKTALRETTERRAAAREALETQERIYRRALADLEQRRGTLRVAEATLEAAEERVRSLDARRDETAAERRRLDDLTAPTPPDEDPDEVREDLAAARRAAQRAGEARDAARAARDRAVRAFEEARERHAELQRRRAATEARRAELERQLADVRERRAALADPVDVDAAAAEAERADGHRVAAEERADERRSALAEAQNALAAAAGEARARSRAAERARAAYEARRGYAQGPRNALTSGIDGVVGSVADLLRVPEELQAAIASALGRRAEYVVVETADVAKKVLRHVRERGGWVTLLPLDLVEGSEPRLPARIEGAAGVRGLALDLIDVSPRFASLARNLLGSTTVVETMDDALAFATPGRDRWRPRFVTVEGDLLEASGAMTGGKRHQGVGVLGAAADLEEAEAAAADAAQASEALEAKVAELQDAMRDAADELERAREAARSAQAERVARERAAESRDQREADLHEREEGLSAALAELDRTLEHGVGAGEGAAAEATGSGELDALRDAAERRRAEAERAEELFADAGALVGDLQRRADLLDERWNSFRAARAQHERDVERREQLDALRSDLDGRAGVARQALEEAREARDAAAEAMPTDVDAKANAYEAARAEVREVEAALDAQGEAQATRGQELENVRVTLARREAALEIAREAMTEFPEGVPRLDLSERAAKSRLRDVETELEAIGPVNHRAAQEAASERERFETLEVETVQAALAASELESTLQRLDRETTERLTEATDSLRDRYIAHIHQLFGERAHADIDVLTDEGRPTGLRLALQPPGKQTTALNLLSVGERTMGALGFLFALMAADEAGLPLAVLDEVDAPLDEANIRRYTHFVASLARRGTQFLLITHQKATFEIADVLWGVTTDQGVSRVFSIARSELEGPEAASEAAD